ncbi:MAG: ATP-binding protein [Ferruginibacter sp.]
MQKTANLNLQSTILIVAFIILLLICFVGFVLVIFYYKRKKLKQQQTELKAQFAQILLQSQIEIQEQTLRHISRELHDNLGQVASLIKINLNTLKYDNIESVVQKIENTKELTRQMIGDIKSLSVKLGSDRIAEIGFAKSIETEVERLNKTGEFNATYRLTGEMPSIDNDKSVILYRMSQEILNNMVKHSQAKQMNISLTCDKDSLVLLFEDDGIGFQPEGNTNVSGAGLQNLKSRALLINAALDIQSSPGNGTTIRIGLKL